MRLLEISKNEDLITLQRYMTEIAFSSFCLFALFFVFLSLKINQINTAVVAPCHVGLFDLPKNSANILVFHFQP